MSNRYDLPIVENCLVCKLRKDNFFCALPRASLEALERIKIATLLPKDTPVFAEGESARGIYILCQGQVKLSMTDVEGKTLIVGVASQSPQVQVGFGGSSLLRFRRAINQSHQGRAILFGCARWRSW